MSRRNNNGAGSKPNLNLKLNLSLSRIQIRENNASRMQIDNEEGSTNNSSSPSSCVSSEYASSPEATSMVLAACPQCLMYVMLAENDPKCPKCKNNVLLDFLDNSKKSNKS